jgi:hypothetical protein
VARTICTVRSTFRVWLREPPARGQPAGDQILTWPLPWDEGLYTREAGDKEGGTVCAPFSLTAPLGSLSSNRYTQVSVTGLVNPFGFDAVQWKIWVVTGWKISRVISVSVRTGFTPIQFGFGQPATAPLTVGEAVSVAGFVVNVRFPFLIASAGMAVSEVAGPASTLF